MVRFLLCLGRCWGIFPPPAAPGIFFHLFVSLMNRCTPTGRFLLLGFVSSCGSIGCIGLAKRLQQTDLTATATGFPIVPMIRGPLIRLGLRFHLDWFYSSGGGRGVLAGGAVLGGYFWGMNGRGGGGGAAGVGGGTAGFTQPTSSFGFTRF